MEGSGKNNRCERERKHKPAGCTAGKREAYAGCADRFRRRIWACPAGRNTCQPSVFAVSDFCRQAAEIEAGKREAVIKTGNLDVKRDFTDVRDVVRAYALLAEKGQAGETYNVGSGQAKSIREMIQIILEKTMAAVRVEVDFKRLRPVDVPEIRADISKMQDATGWEPVIALDQTVQDMLDYWRMIIGNPHAPRIWHRHK